MAKSPESAIGADAAKHSLTPPKSRRFCECSKSALLYSSSCVKRMPIVALSVPYTSALPSTAITIPNSVPNSCEKKAHATKPPSAVCPKIPQQCRPKRHTDHAKATHRVHRRFSSAVLRQSKHIDKQGACDRTHEQSRDRCIKSEPAHRDQARQRTVVDKTGSFLPATKAFANVPPTIAINEFTATKPEISAIFLRTHHVKAEPANRQRPRAQSQKRNLRKQTH